MSYTPTVWIEGETPLNPDNLNNLESQYESAIADIIPSEPGIIAMWSGTLANIPDGWLLCDGNNGTPNMLGRFPVCVPNAETEPGSTGGSISKTSNSHSHAFSGSIGYSGAHNHSYSTTYFYAGLGDVPVMTGISAVGDHTHSMPSLSSATVTIADGRPPYFELAFVMRT